MRAPPQADMPRRSSRGKRGRKGHPPPPAMSLTATAPPTRPFLAEVDPNLFNLVSYLRDQMELLANLPNRFIETTCGGINEMIDQALAEGEGALSKEAQHLAHDKIFGRTAAEQQERKEYMKKLLAGAPRGLKDSPNSPYHTPSATTPLTKVYKKLENNFAKMKREMRELDKMMGEIRQKLDNYRDKLNSLQPSQSKDISE